MHWVPTYYMHRRRICLDLGSAPGGPQDGFRVPREGPRRAKKAPRGLSDDPRGPESPSGRSRTVHMASRRPKRPPNRPEGSFRALQGELQEANIVTIPWKCVHSQHV
eukprot:7392057-Pyramimonas_sp.AAC.1